MEKRKTDITTANGSLNFRQKLNENSPTAAFLTSDPKHILQEVQQYVGHLTI